MRRPLWLLAITPLAAGLFLVSGAMAAPLTLQATTAIPTVTGTPEGPTVLAAEQVNVRTGPGTNYERIGVLIAGQRVPALGRSPGGDWIQISYAGAPDNVGWVYAYNVTLEVGNWTLSAVEPPPIPTPRLTATIDPTLAAQFPSLGLPQPTRLPTFTPAPPVVQPTFPPAASPGESRGFPPILAILGLVVVGGFGMLISFLRAR